MLFSEPKIPQLSTAARATREANRVSVLFSEPKIPQFKFARHHRAEQYEFQCSSASRKFLNSTRFAHLIRAPSVCFSALQRAENSSIKRSSISHTARVARFSALQRAENSSIGSSVGATTPAINVSVLFSEPKIPQF